MADDNLSEQVKQGYQAIKGAGEAKKKCDKTDPIEYLRCKDKLIKGTDK